MSKPSPHDNPINSSSTGWVSRLNSNFEDCTDSPFPMILAVNSGTLASSYNAKLYGGCLALVGASGSAMLYISDGTSWGLHRAHLTFIADLVPGVATIADIQTAYNGLLADAIAKGWMSA